MNYYEIIEKLKSLGTDKNRRFTEKLVPNATNILGVTVPLLRELAKEIAKGDYKELLNKSTFSFYEETFLYGLVISYIKLPFTQKLPYLELFIPKVNNWAICDSVFMTLKIAKVDREKAWNYAVEMVQKEGEFEKRVGIVLLLRNFLDDQHVNQVVNVIDNISSDAYYVNMALSWLICDLVIKYKDIALQYIPISKLNDFVINKGIQKCRESYRVDDDTKKLLLQYKR